MRTNVFVFFGVAVLGFASCASRVLADFFAAADLRVGAQGVLGEPANFTIGYKFTVGSTPITINALGLNSGIGNIQHGSNPAVPVSIWQSGTTTNLASVSIDNADPLSSLQAGGSLQYYYAPITPLVLQANTTYDIGADLQVANQGAAFSGTVVSDARIVVGSPISGAGTFPTGNSEGLPEYFGPSFQIASVPEPSSIALVAVGMLVGAVKLRLRKRSLAKA